MRYEQGLLPFHRLPPRQTKSGNPPLDYSQILPAHAKIRSAFLDTAEIQAAISFNAMIAPSPRIIPGKMPLFPCPLSIPDAASNCALSSLQCNVFSSRVSCAFLLPMRQVKSESLLGLIGLAAGAERPAPVGALSFDAARFMSKAAHLWRGLADDRLALLRNEALRHTGVRRLVSDDDDFLLALALAEITDALGSLSRDVSCLSLRCSDPVLRRFDVAFACLAKAGVDPFGFEYAERKMDRKVQKMERFAAVASDLRREMEALAEMKQSSRRARENADFRSKLRLQRQRVECLREASLWPRTFDYVVRLLGRSLFSFAGRIRQVFGDAEMVLAARRIAVKNRTFAPQCFPAISCLPSPTKWSNLLNRSRASTKFHLSMIDPKFQLLNFPADTLSAAALALHYAKLILLIEKLAMCPHLIDAGDRDELYNMLPWSLRAALRARMKRSKSKNGEDSPAYYAEQAVEWSAAVARTLEWLAPLARRMIRWFAERSFEQTSATPASSILLVQTLHYADRRKTEEVITELLVGLDYLRRYGSDWN